MCAETRKYELGKRAETMRDTQRRITEAAVELHGTVGPARTTISAVAERAGVQRHTVYRHFPTETDLFAACSGHYWGTNPWPDTAAWRAIADPGERLEAALDETYRYYERTSAMLANVLRDAPLAASMGPALEPMDAFLSDAVAALRAGRPRRRVVAVALRHVLQFPTWQSLARDGGLKRAEAVALGVALVDGA
jgi:AcrR family transcriptional regulator